MHHELKDFLVTVMSITSGIERRQDFFKTILLEMARAFRTRRVHLLVGDPSQDCLTLVGGHPLLEQMGRPGVKGQEPKPAELESLKPLCRSSHGECTLLLPFRHLGAPLLCLRLNWPESGVPLWIHDEDSLTSFAEKLGSYLSWGNVLLQIAASKRRLQAIFDLIPRPVGVIGPDHTIERANKAFVELFNRGFHDTIGCKCYEVIHRSEEPYSDCPLQRVIHDQICVEQRLNNGTPLQVTHMPLHEDNGTFKSLVIFGSAAVKRAGVAAPNDSNLQFLRLYDSLSQPLTVISLIADLMLLNPEERVSTEYLEITRRKIDRIMNILKREREGCLLPPQGKENT